MIAAIFKGVANLLSQDNRLILNWDIKDPQVQKGIKKLKEEGPVEFKSGMFLLEIREPTIEDLDKCGLNPDYTIKNKNNAAHI